MPRHSDAEILTESRAARRGLIGAYLELSKARLSALVVLTTAVGYIMAYPQPVDWTRFLITLVGTTLAAWGANAMNQVMEADRDARMVRTRHRPIPAGQLTRRAALVFGIIVGALGPALLWAFVGLGPAVLALGTLLLYVGVYTPMKVYSPLNTLVGAVVGAIPPVIGWVAAVGYLDWGALIIAGVLFLWQIPHFLGLAWMYREDYARGGFKMLPGADPNGRLTAAVCVLYSLMLVPVAMALTVVGAAGFVYAWGALALGLMFASLSVALERERSDAAARRLFFGSLLYLPVLLGLMVANRAAPERPMDDASIRMLGIFGPQPIQRVSETSPGLPPSTLEPTPSTESLNEPL